MLCICTKTSTFNLSNIRASQSKH